MAILLGLLAAAFYGSADFCGGMAARRSSIFSVTAISQAAGFGLLLVLLPFAPAHPRVQDFGWGLIAGICGGAGLALLYHALRVGTMGIVSPITAVLAAGLPVGIGFLRGQYPSAVQLAGIAVALLAVVLIAFSNDPGGRREFATAGVREAVLSGLLLGGVYVLLAMSGKHAGLYPLVTARAGSAGLLALVALALRAPLRPAAGGLPLIALAGLLDMSANALYVLATFAGELAIAAVLTSLYPASTVFLARIILRERLQPQQWAGVFCALVGVVLIAL